MRKLLIVLFLFSIAFNLQSQEDIAKQEILELTDSELEKIGVLMKGKEIIIKNDMPDFDEYHLIVEGNKYIPIFEDKENYPVTEFDFYPYYITNMDSLWGFMWSSDKENELKGDPLFIRKMMMNYLVPVHIKQSDEKEKWGDGKLYWFTPTESFCKALPKRYKISRRYTSDSLITSDVALMLNDEELRNIGFTINDEEISIDTYVPKKGYVVSWHFNKTACGSSMSSGISDDKLKKMFPKNKNFDMLNAGYYLIQVSNLDSSKNLSSSSFIGRAIPFYIRNSNRNVKCKNDVVVYLKYSLDLVEKLPKRCKWWKMPDVYTVHLKPASAE